MLRGMPWVGVVAGALVLGLGAAEAGAAKNRMLDKAKQAYDNLDYGKVIPLVNKALKAGLSPEDEVEAYFLLGTVHTIYSRDKQAQEAFLELLNRSPDYEVPADTSPKIREALDQAKTARAAVPSPTPGSPTTVDASDGTGPSPETTPPPPEPATVTAPPIDPLAIMTGADAMQPSVRRRGAPFYSTWWFWTAVGVVVAGGSGALGYYLLQPRYPERDFGPIPLR